VDELDRVVASNLRRLLADRQWRHADLAVILNIHGLAWTANRVTQVTTERQSATLLELAALCATFETPLSSFLAGECLVATPAGAPVPLAMVRDSLATGSFEHRPGPVAYMHVPADEELAAVRRLALPNVGALHRLAKWALGTTNITEERDRRAGDPAGVSERSLRAKRGHAMRNILAELRAYHEAHPEVVAELVEAQEITTRTVAEAFDREPQTERS